MVLTNQQSGAAFTTITNTIKDSYLGIPNRNWLKTFEEKMSTMNAEFEKGKKEVFSKISGFSLQKNQHLKAEQFIGTYQDNWFGEVEISKTDGGYRIFCKTSPRLKGELLPYSPHTFVAKWDDRSYDADAFVVFQLDEKGNATSAKMKPISDITDFSFDFEDLDLKKIDARQ